MEYERRAMNIHQIDGLFRDAISLHPKEAKSHFEVVDPGVWRFDVLGRLSGLGEEWVGPYQFHDDGVSYDAYGLSSRITASQELFLCDLGILSQKREPYNVVKFTVVGIVTCLLIAIAVYIFNVGAVDVKNECVRNEQAEAILNEMYAKVEQRERHHQALMAKSSQVDRPAVRQKNISIKERARAAFKESRWSEAINLVDQLSDAEADAELRYYIGICYKEGNAVGHDYAEAFYWFKSAAEMGSAPAQFELGLAYEKGNGVAANTSEAIKWYGKAAKRGNAMANLYLGLMYDEGHGVAQNPPEAAMWYQKAVDLGNAHAGYLLGGMYYDGRGVAQSFSAAAELYRKAASSGHARAGLLLGEMYEKGVGVEQSNSEALYWYKRAGELGNSEALSAWQRLSNTDKQWIYPKK